MTRLNAAGPLMPAVTPLLVQAEPDLPFRLPRKSQAERQVASASNSHCTAFAVMGDGDGVRFQCESKLELDTLYILNARHDIVWIREQANFYCDPVKKTGRHVFDFMATLRNGRRIAFSVKPESRLSWRRKGQLPGEDFITELQTVAYHVQLQNFADDVRLVTEEDLDPVDLYNAEVIAAVREPDPEADQRALDLTRDLIGSRTIRDLARDIGMAGRGNSAILRLVRTGTLIGQPGRRLTPNALVTRKGIFQ